ncbi:hypothetical protein ACF0H5_012997 [Mactra antiquata]
MYSETGEGKKKCDYMQELLLDIIYSYYVGLKELKDPIERLSSDPANIVETIAPSPPYQTKELVKAIEARLKFGPVGKI